MPRPARARARSRGEELELVGTDEATGCWLLQAEEVAVGCGCREAADFLRPHEVPDLDFPAEASRFRPVSFLSLLVVGGPDLR